MVCEINMEQLFSPDAAVDRGSTLLAKFFNVLIILLIYFE